MSFCWASKQLIEEQLAGCHILSGEVFVDSCTNGTSASNTMVTEWDSSIVVLVTYAQCFFGNGSRSKIWNDF